MIAELVGRPMEILLIEDSLMAAKLAAHAVRDRQFDHRLTWISDGQEAIDFLLQERQYGRAPRPDLILLDLILPQKSGQEILAVIRGQQELREIPVVVMTGESQESTGSLDVAEYVTKPFNAQDFQRILDRLRGRWRTGMLLPQPDEKPFGGLGLS
ncbi:MAG: response regulator [Planctomycetaceae bacterium]|nr:response regulator [Planctomycetaceae bacterium]